MLKKVYFIKMVAIIALASSYTNANTPPAEDPFPNSKVSAPAADPNLVQVDEGNPTTSQSGVVCLSSSGPMAKVPFTTSAQCGNHTVVGVFEPKENNRPSSPSNGGVKTAPADTSPATQ